MAFVSTTRPIEAAQALINLLESCMNAPYPKFAKHLIAAHWPEICSVALSVGRRHLAMAGGIGTVPYLSCVDELVGMAGHLKIPLPLEFLQVGPRHMTSFERPYCSRISNSDYRPRPMARHSFLSESPYWLRMREVLATIDSGAPNERARHFVHYLRSPCKRDALRSAAALPMLDEDKCVAPNLSIGLAIAILWRQSFSDPSVSLPATFDSIAESENLKSRLVKITEKISVPPDLRAAYIGLQAAA